MSEDRNYLWVMEGAGVLQNFSTGLICVYAPDEQTAWKQLGYGDEDAYIYMRLGERDWLGFEKAQAIPLEELPMRFRRVDEPSAFVCWGSE